jgi:hypothetical protein
MSVDSPYNHRRSLLHVGGLYHCETIYKPKLRLSDDNEKADGHTINCVDVNQNKKLYKKKNHLLLLGKIIY